MKYLDFFTENGRINSMKVRESWVQKNDPEFIEAMNLFTNDNELSDIRFVEKLWYYFNGITKRLTCKNEDCLNSTGFRNLKEGYLAYCSSRCSNGSNEVKQAKVNSCIKKFGVANPYQSPEIIKKIKKTTSERYGVENVMQSKYIKDGMINRSIEKTGKPWSLSNGGNARLTIDRQLLEKFKDKYTEFEIIEYSKKKFGVCILRKEACGHSFEINKWQLHQRTTQGVEACTICNPIGSFNETVWQSEIENFLIENNVSYLKNDRSVLGNLEIDFYLPEFKIGIELDGIYWHSIKHKNPDYHIVKTERCEKLGIQLIHVFEDEWTYRKDVVFSRIKNLLNLSSTRIYARLCEVRELSGKETQSFIDENHIQGNIPASKRIGLFYKDELVSVMTFGALRRALGSTPKDGVYEMYRFCNRLNYSIVGGASKLLKYFIRTQKPVEIISYADRRWSIGKLYTSLGFTLVKKTQPNYWYIVGDRREHRFNYTKKKLKLSNIDEFDLNRIFDSGNLRFELRPVY
jgi:very-short-patch-repair endonuclease